MLTVWKGETRTCSASTIAGSLDFFMCAQTWICRLMHASSMAVARNTSVGAAVQGVAARHSAASGVAGLNACINTHCMGSAPHAGKPPGPKRLRKLKVQRRQHENCVMLMACINLASVPYEP